MNIRRMSVAAAAFGLAVLCGDVVLAQGTTTAPTAQREIRIRDIRKDLIKAPNFAGVDMGGGRPGTLYTDWLRIEVQFETRLEWADDIVVKYYVLMGRDRNMKLFSGELTHINVAKGTTHFSAMYVHPNTVKRYGDGRVEAVAVQVYYQGRLMDQRSEPQANKRWWEEHSPTPGYVLSPLLTPWSVSIHERYEAIKP